MIHSDQDPQATKTNFTSLGLEKYNDLYLFTLLVIRLQVKKKKNRFNRSLGGIYSPYSITNETPVLDLLALFNVRRQSSLVEWVCQWV